MQGWCCGFVFDDVDSCQDVPQYKVMKYLVLGIILSSLLSELQLEVMIPKVQRLIITMMVYVQYLYCISQD